MTKERIEAVPQAQEWTLVRCRDGMKPSEAPRLVMQGDRNGSYIVADGVRIAARGLPGTRHAGTWIPLQPGVTVRDSADGKELIVEFDGVRAH